MNKLTIALIFLALSLDAKMISRTQVVMSTFITITADQKDKKFIEDGFKIIKDAENSLSSYNPKTPIYLLNKNRYAKLDKYAYEALSLSKKYYEKTDGYFDITIGSITKDLYGFGEKNRLPSSKELSDAKVCFNNIRFNENEAFLKKEMKVDLGGMGKGFSIDKVRRYFIKNGVKEGVISASGDIRCLSTCKINIQNPFIEDASLASFETAKEDLGITTSGNYNRYVLSTQNNHLINPKSKKPQTDFISVTLIGELSNSDLDAYATAISVMPLKEAYKFLQKIKVGYIILQSDKELVISKNISKYADNLLVDYTIKKKPKYIEYKSQKSKKRK